MLLWLPGMNCVEIWTHCMAEHLMAQHGEVMIYILEAELKMDASQTVKEQKYWVLTWLHASYMSWKCHKVQTQAQWYKLTTKPSKNEVGMEWETK